MAINIYIYDSGGGKEEGRGGGGKDGRRGGGGNNRRNNRDRRAIVQKGNTKRGKRGGRQANAVRLFDCFNSAYYMPPSSYRLATTAAPSNAAHFAATWVIAASRVIVATRTIAESRVL